MLGSSSIVPDPPDHFQGHSSRRFRSHLCGFFKASSQVYPASGFHRAYTLSLRGGDRDILTNYNMPKPNPTCVQAKSPTCTISLLI